MTERCCETCVHYPPSSFGGKPCSCCNPDDLMTSCWDGKPEKEYIERMEHRGMTPVAKLEAELAICRIPAADVKPVVRAGIAATVTRKTTSVTAGSFERAGCVFPVDDDYFCAYGER